MEYVRMRRNAVLKVGGFSCLRALLKQNVHSQYMPMTTLK
eukprot:CAMPEP_0172918124 /NCGR_PEP_ID=MMETSP1075-20121228/199536_1 /TAXON_ID=2916 /ORGANISM="Ceratium fusus, Strain PA161109" /LENGTH=39 /DNA_ID= /DNA_START= /DNA_END= /DNA_ORIENTATION=